MSETIVQPASTRRRVALLAGVVRYADRKLGLLIIVALLLSSLAGAIQSLGLKWLVDAALEQRSSSVIVAALLGGLGAGLLGSASRAMSDTEMVITAQVGLIVDRNSLELTASMPGVEHLEQPEYLDQLALVRSGGQSLMRAVFTLTRTASLAISMVASLWLLFAVHPTLLLTPLCAVPTAILVPRSERYKDQAKAFAAERQRASTQLHQLFLAPGPAMEMRVFDAADNLDAQSDRLWREVSGVQLRGSVKAALLSSLGWLALTAGYIAALLLTAYLAIEGRATVGDIVLVSQLALLIRGNVAQTAEAARKAAAALRTADRFIWLQDLHAEQTARYAGRSNPPAALEHGIAFEGVSFAYPGTDEFVLDQINLMLPAGGTIAIVGANGAGKTTLVKLLTGMYQPTAGRITVDGIDLADIDIQAWRAAIAGTFQDFLRLETTAATTIGVGNPPRQNDTTRIDQAVDDGEARVVIDRLPDGFSSHLGKTYRDGAELSGGQWQRLAIARGMMPDTPLLYNLDEPTAALDPAAEQALYEHYRTAAGKGGSDGAITVLVSHRFSSVRMADLIVVLDQHQVAEKGSHDELLTQDGLYAAMYRQQAAAYE